MKLNKGSLFIITETQFAIQGQVMKQPNWLWSDGHVEKKGGGGGGQTDRQTDRQTDKGTLQLYIVDFPLVLPAAEKKGLPVSEAVKVKRIWERDIVK